MSPELLEIQPRELKFTFELKKQSSCSVQLRNNSDHYVAFKVKTTSPKRYCVRPNTGVVLPKSICEFTVTMQAQREAPPDMQCKDKFLIQSTLVPFGTAPEDIKSTHFSKENGRYIEENKLKVVLVSPPHSPVLMPINGVPKEEPVCEAPVLKQEPILKLEPMMQEQEMMMQEPLFKEEQVLKQEPVLKAEPVLNQEPILNDELSIGAENCPPPHFDVSEEVEVVKDVEELKSKISNFESQLNEAEKTIAKLREERTTTIRDKEMLQQELALVKSGSVQKVQVGFPFFFVCFIALVGMILGYMLHT